MWAREEQHSWEPAKPFWFRKGFYLLLVWLTVLGGLPAMTHITRPRSEPEEQELLNVRRTETVPQSRPARTMEGQEAAVAITAQGEPTAQEKEPNIQQRAVVMAKESPTTAVRWCESLPREQRTEVGLTVAYELSRTDPTEALRLLRTLPASEDVEEAVVHSVRQWAETDPDRAVRWAFEVPDSQMRSKLVSAVATTLAQVDGPSAARLAVSDVEDETEQARTVVEVAEEWAQHDRVGALAWVEQFPDGPLKKATGDAMEAQRGGDAVPDL